MSKQYQVLAIFLLGYFFGVGVSLFCLAVIGVPW